MKRYRWPLVLLLWISLGPALGAHITDKLLAGFYQAPGGNSEPLRLLPSGTPLEVLGHKGSFTQVRLADGETGWVNSTYVTTEKPARVMLLEAQATAGELHAQLAQARKQLKAQGATSSGPTAVAGEPKQAPPPPVEAPPTAPGHGLMATLLLIGSGLLVGLAGGYLMFRCRRADPDH